MVARPARMNPPMQSVRLLDPETGLDGVIGLIVGAVLIPLVSAASGLFGGSKEEAH